MKLEIGNIYTISEKLKNAFSVQEDSAKVLSISSGIVMLEIDGKPFPLKQTLAISNLSKSLRLTRVNQDEQVEDEDERHTQPQDQNKVDEDESQHDENKSSPDESEEEAQQIEDQPKNNENVLPVEENNQETENTPEEEVVPEEENSISITPENDEIPQDNTEPEKATDPWGDDGWNEYNPDEDFF